MLRLHWPCCGSESDETEVSPGCAAHLLRHGPGASEAVFDSYLFMRVISEVVHFECLRHVHGCGKWFLAARDTATLEVFGTYSAQTTRPPAHIRAAIRAGRPDRGRQ